MGSLSRLCRLDLLFSLLIFSSLVYTCTWASPRRYDAMRMGCGLPDVVYTDPNNTEWKMDYGFKGGIPVNNASRLSHASPPLNTLRYFPLSEGPRSCYRINYDAEVSTEHFSVRVFFGSLTIDGPVFDVSLEGTLISSLKSGWTTNAEKTFTESQVSIMDDSVSICFHNTGHGDPAVLAVEIVEVDVEAYNYRDIAGQNIILQTVSRINCGGQFGAEYGEDPWAGTRYWNPVSSFVDEQDSVISTEASITQVAESPNSYPSALYQTAIVSSQSKPDIEYTVEVRPGVKYSIWLHFAEIQPEITGVGQRVFDVMANGDVVFENVDIVNMTGESNTALVLNSIVAVNGRSVTITLRPRAGDTAIICGLEIFEIIVSEFQTSAHEVSALEDVRRMLGLPVRLGWINGDPCVPQEHPWSGVGCRLDMTTNNWVIHQLTLDNQGLMGNLPHGISALQHLTSINLSGNNIQFIIPSSIGELRTLEILDLSYNSINGSIPETIVNLPFLKILYLNNNLLSGRISTALSQMLSRIPKFNFRGNNGLCGNVPGLATCGPQASCSAKMRIGFVSVLVLILLYHM